MMRQLWRYLIGSYEFEVLLYRVGQHMTGQQAAQEYVGQIASNAPDAIRADGKDGSAVSASELRVPHCRRGKQRIEGYSKGELNLIGIQF